MDTGPIYRQPAGARSVVPATVVWGGVALLVGGMTLAMPDIALQASLRGVQVWWEVLFPALFPFFVLSEMLLGFGIVHLAGMLLDPLMRPLFRLPGAGAFVVAMGFASGYPVGARLTSRLMEQKLLSRAHGERLVEMTTTSDPIFLIGAVSVGFFGRPEAAPILALAHYGGAMILGFIGRWRRDPEGILSIQDAASPPGGRIRAGLAAMHRARMADGRPFAVLLHQAIQSSLHLMMIVGGLVVFFSAALDLLLHSGFLLLFRDATAVVLDRLHMPSGLSPAFVQGTFEVTLGARAAAEAAEARDLLPLVDRLAAAAFILSWAGLSVHAQVAGLMGGTGWRYGPFARTRLLHGIMAAGIVYLTWPFFHVHGDAAVPSWMAGSAGAPLPPLVWAPIAAFAVLAVLAVAGTAAIALSRWRNRLQNK